MSLAVVGFINVRVGSLVGVSSGTFGFALVYSGPPRDREVHSGSRLVHYGAPIGRREHSRFRGLTPALLRVFGIILISVCSLWSVDGSSGSFGFLWAHSGARSYSRFLSGSRGFTRACLGVFRVSLGSLGFT